MVEQEDSFDSADLEEVDSDEGVGVDERASLLTPADFLLDDDDEEWFANARWVLSRHDTVGFIEEALLAHLAPLYVPYAPIDASKPAAIVPADVRAELRAFAQDFVADQNLYNQSVQDVKDGISAALGKSGADFMPGDVPAYDDDELHALGGGEADGADGEGAVGGQLGFFAEKFADTEDAWDAWRLAFEEEDGNDSDGDDSSEGSDSEGDGAPGDGGALADASVESADSERSAGGEGQAAAAAAALVREIVEALLERHAGVVGIPACAEGAFAALLARLRSGRNARNALLLFKALTAAPLPPPDAPGAGATPLPAEVVAQLVLRALLAGPLRAVRLDSEDCPPHAVRAARLLARELAARPDAPATAEAVLEAARASEALARASAGWCLKFLFEGAGMLQQDRRRAAFAQYAEELALGPLARVRHAGAGDMQRSEQEGPAAPAGLAAAAEAFAAQFELAHGDSLASVLAVFRAVLRAAGVPLAPPWLDPAGDAAPSPEKPFVPSTGAAAAAAAAAPSAAADAAAPGGEPGDGDGDGDGEALGEDSPVPVVALAGTKLAGTPLAGTKLAGTPLPLPPGQ